MFESILLQLACKIVSSLVQLSRHKNKGSNWRRTAVDLSRKRLGPTVGQPDNGLQASTSGRCDQSIINLWTVKHPHSTFITLSTLKWQQKARPNSWQTLNLCHSENDRFKTQKKGKNVISILILIYHNYFMQGLHTRLADMELRGLVFPWSPCKTCAGSSPQLSPRRDH